MVKLYCKALAEETTLYNSATRPGMKALLVRPGPELEEAAVLTGMQMRTRGGKEF